MWFIKFVRRCARYLFVCARTRLNFVLTTNITQYNSFIRTYLRTLVHVITDNLLWVLFQVSSSAHTQEISFKVLPQFFLLLNNSNLLHLLLYFFTLFLAFVSVSVSVSCFFFGATWLHALDTQLLLLLRGKV